MHSFKKGDTVFIINSTMGGRYFVEGKAEVTRINGDDDEFYGVRFESDPNQTFDRHVCLDAQADPEGYVKALNAIPRRV